MSLYINSLAVSAPKKVLTNFDLEKLMDTNDEWIRTRTGIEERHILEKEENISTFAIDASKKALSLSAIEAKELTHIFVATCTPQMLMPSMACIIAGSLDMQGNKNLYATDINAACSGFVYALELVRASFALNPQAKVLLVTSEALSRRLNYQDRSTSILFGDAAAAVVLTADTKETKQSQFQVIDSLCYTDGALKDLIRIGGGTQSIFQVGDFVEEDFFLQMQGQEVYKHAIRSMSNSCKEILERNNLTLNDIRFAVPHQANIRIINAVYDKLNVPEQARFVNVQKYGNTSAASIPLALEEIIEQKILKSGDIILLTTFGGGLTWGSALLKVA